jgi:hypothetical protein
MHRITNRTRPRGRAFPGPRQRRRAGLVIASLVSAAALSTAAAEPASAWAWDPNVNVVGSVGSCGPSNTTGWGWYTTSDGDQGWATWGNGSTFTLPLHHVSTSGSSITFKWGVASCTAVRYFVVHRPAWGNNAAVGYLG